MDRNIKNKIPIVYYHSVADTPLSTSIANFKDQMKYLEENNFTTILFKDLIGKNYDKNKKNVVITFDDCFLDVYYNAIPVLNRYGFLATFFATLGYDDVTLWGSEKEQRWNNEKTDSFNISYRFMNEKHRKELVSLGMEIGSHTINHFNLDELDNFDLDYEIKTSKQFIESELGVQCESFCYPRGRYNRHIVSCVREMYRGACITESGYYQDSKSQHEILRFGIGNDNNYFYDVVDNKLNILRHRIIRKLKRILNSL